MTLIAFPRILLIVCLFVAIIGCRGDTENNASNVGETIGESVTEFAKGIGKGVDNRLQVSIELSPALAQRGVSTTVAKQAQLEVPSDNPKSISVYCIATTAINATLIAKAYTVDDQEIGRARADVTFGDDDAQYVTFSFPPEMDRQLVAKYLVDFADRKPEADGTEAALE
jgi:hypothetical protein